MAETLSTAMIYTLMGLIVLTGSINTITNKLMQKTVSLDILYEHHQKFITFCMFLGETVCLLIYYMFIHKEEEKRDSLLIVNRDSGSRNLSAQSEERESTKVEGLIDTNEEPKFYYFLFPAMCDLFGSTLMSIGLTYLASSVYQMFRGMLIFFTAIAGRCFLGHKTYSHRILGIVLVIGGLAIVGLNSVLSKNSASSSPVAGIILVLLAQVFSAGMFIVEEKLLKQYKVHALKAVGDIKFENKNGKHQSRSADRDGAIGSGLAEWRR